MTSSAPSSTRPTAVKFERPYLEQFSLEPESGRQATGSFASRTTLSASVDIADPEGADLATLFDAWIETSLDRTPISDDQHQRLCTLLAALPADGLLVASRHKPAAGENPAADLKRWLTPDVSVPTIAEACGVSTRAFYGWLEGGGIRERNARRVHDVRSIVQALMLRLGRPRAIAWLLSSQPALDLRSPLDAMRTEGLDRVLDLLRSVIPATSRPPIAGPRIAEDEEEDFSFQELRLEQLGPDFRPRRRRRRG
jgi:hypothetical protein